MLVTGTDKTANWNDQKKIEPPAEWLIGQQTLQIEENENRLPQASLYASCSRNNLGPVNPWDDWESETGEEIQKGRDMVNPTKIDHWPVSLSAMASSPITLSDPRYIPTVPPKIPFHNDPFEMVTGHEGSGAWATIGEPAILYSMAETEENTPVEMPAEAPVGEPILRGTKSIDMMSWLQNTTEDSSPDTSTTQPQHAIHWYNRHSPTPSIHNSFSVSFPASPSADQNQPAQVSRARLQTDVDPQHIASMNRRMAATSVPLSPPHISGNEYSSTPSILLSNSQDGVAPRGQPGDVCPGARANGISQSRRRRAMMEAAIGVYGI